MPQSYAQLQEKIATLQRQAEALRQKEVAGVISKIKVAIGHYGITAQQLGFGASTSSTKVVANKPQKSSSSESAKFSDGNGQSWSGRGKRPNWLRAALAAGASIEDFAVAPTAVTADAKTKTRKIKRRPSTVVYRDGTGNSWTGRGPQPRWMKEALAAGKTLEDLKS